MGDLGRSVKETVLNFLDLRNRSTNVVRHACCCLTIAGALALRTSLVSAVEIAPYRHSVGEKAPNAHVPYMASRSLTEASAEITRLIVSIHSSGFDALQYFENACDAAAAKGVMAETLIVAPQFFEQKAIPGSIPDGLLFWRVSPFRGSSRGGIGPEVTHVGISAFDVLDDWLTVLTDRQLFPNLTDVVLVGHSGGGQLVQRYAMVGRFEPGPGATLRFVVSAPSSYAYPSAERFNLRSQSFVVPSDSVIASCPKYNDWGYGLGAPYGYFADVRTELIAQRYARRNVFYLCGSKDTDPNDASLGKSCGAMMQGRYRLERMQVFAAFLDMKYGKSIKNTHKFAVVRGMGHYGKGTMTSGQGLVALFSEIR
jgi:pimeloyl-ACP methyl ester carboxylesterase